MPNILNKIVAGDSFDSFAVTENSTCQSNANKCANCNDFKYQSDGTSFKYNK